MRQEIRTAYSTQTVEFEIGNVIQFENLTFQNAYWGIVTDIHPDGYDSLGVMVMVIDPETLKPMVWATGDVRFDIAFFQNIIYVHFDTLTDFMEHMGMDNE